MNNALSSSTTCGPISSPIVPPGPSDVNDSIAPYSSPSSRQQRLLRLRNDNFASRSSLSGTVFNSRLSGLNTENGSPPLRNQENTSSRTNVQPRKYRTTSSLGILAEISNSVRSVSLGGRERDQLGRQAVPIFSDTPQKGLLEPSPEGTPPAYQNSSSSPVDSPFRFEHIQDSFTMGLREVSGNARKSPLAEHAPWSHGSKASRRRQTTLSSRFNSDEYIDRIEKELELANCAVYSPSSNRTWRDKLKQSEADNERLRQELADVKATFESEVQNAVQHKTAAELILRRRIRALEEIVEQKDSALRDAQVQHDDGRHDQGLFDSLRATVERLEAENQSLEQSNQSMSKRNEVLSHLLALSPTKTQHTLDLEAPLRDPPRRLSKSQRPQSLLLPRVASSPTHTHPQRPHSLIGSPVLNNGLSSSPGLYSPSSPLSPDHNARSLYRPDLSRSRSGYTGTRSHSRSSTIASYVSQSPSTSEHASTSSSTDPNTRPNTNRRRRRMHGSTQLKPLLLPTLTGEFGPLSATSPVCSPTRIARRDFSDESVDPTTMFISQSPIEDGPHAENPLSDPYVSLASKTTARSLAYQSLEGVLDANENDSLLQMQSNDCYFRSKGTSDRGSRFSLSPSTCYALEGLISPRSMSSGEDVDRTLMPPNEVRETHEDESDESPQQLIPYESSGATESVDVPEPLFSTSTRHAATDVADHGPVLSTHDDIDNHGLPLTTGYSRKRRKMSSGSQDERETRASEDLRKVSTQISGSTTTTVDKGIDTRSLNGTETPMIRSRPTSMSLLSPHRSRTPLEILQRKNFGVKPIAVVTIKTIYGTLSKCTTMMRDFRRDPLAVARRVIANAWRCNWAVLGKLSWWVLGLFLGSSSKQQKEQWDWDDFDAEAIADKHCKRNDEDDSDTHQPLLHEQRGGSKSRRVRFSTDDTSRSEGHVPQTSQQQSKPGWGKTVILWGKFSMAIMLAVGGAVIKGPGEMLKEADMRAASSRRQSQRRVSITVEDDDDIADTSSTSVELQAVSPGSTTSECRRRHSSKQGLNSPPPSARAILSRELDLDQFSSSPPVSSSPSIGSFRFGRGQRFDFTLDEDMGLDGGIETLKPRKSARARIEDIFDESTTGTPDQQRRRGQQEYDPASAGFGAFESAPSTPDSLREPSEQGLFG